MQFWHGPLLDLTMLAAVLAVVGLLWQRFPRLGALGVPASMIAGLAALLLGPSGAGILAYDVGTAETLVYHGLALVFVTFGLIPPVAGQRVGSDARSMMLAIPAMAVLQGAVGLGLVLLFSAFGDPLHPGFGLALPLAFSQGPGQALSIGRTWEATGMAHGGQVGLTIAAIGYLWCVIAGGPLLWLGRRMGWTEVARDAATTTVEDAPIAAPRPGELDPLTRHVALIGGITLAVYGILVTLDGLIANPRTQAMVWGFHFLFGVFLAIGLRQTLGWVGVQLDGAVLRRIGGLTVDVVTCAAIAAIQVAVVEAYLVPIVVISTVGGVVTAVACLWLARRAFSEDPFAHAVALFGMSTGTLPTGLALLRALDPDLRSPAARNIVLGCTGAIVPGIPLLLVLVPLPVVGWPESYPTAVYQSFAGMLLYLLLIGGVWWRFGGLRGLFSPTLWAPDEAIGGRW